MEEIPYLAATHIAQHVAAGQLSACEVTKAFLTRIDRFNPAVNAICTPDPSALAAASAVDLRRAAGHPARPLEGVPFLVKDNLETRGLRTTYGSRLMESYVPSQDAICVERLRAAGAILLGKTNCSEFAADINTSNLLFGTTRNPWNLMVTPGGSSGGSAAAVAARFAPLAVGTDLGGSIRIPASFNGIVGVRPAPGRVPVYPTEFGWDTLVNHVVGPLAANTQDAALMLAVMSGPDERDPSTLPLQDVDYVRAASGQVSVSGRRIAFCPDLGGVVPVEPEVKSLAQQAALTLQGLGCHVEEACFDSSGLREIIAGTRGFGMVARFGDHSDGDKQLMTRPLSRQIEAAMDVDLHTVARAEKLRTHYWRRLAEFMRSFDYIILPSCGAPPFRLDEPLPEYVNGIRISNFYDVFLMTYGISIVGLPVAAVPYGFTASGLPVGIQIIAHRHREDHALEAAAAYQAAHPEHFRRPEINPAQAKAINEIHDAPGMFIPRASSAVSAALP